MGELYAYHVARHAQAVCHAAEEGVLQKAWKQRVQDHAKWANAIRKIAQGQI